MTVISTTKIIGMFALCCVLGYGQAGGRADVTPLQTGTPYVLGPGDVFVISAPNAEEISGKPFRVETTGTVEMPMLGAVHPGGKTLEQFEDELKRLLGQYVRNPELTLTVTQFRSQSVTFTGAFRSPGVYQLGGRHTLTEMIAFAGGLNENASRVLRMVRQEANGPLPLDNTRVQASGSSYIATLDITITDGKSLADDFVLMPFDMVTAFSVEPIVIGGEVVRPGVVPLGDHHSLPLTQVLFMSGGPTKDASRRKLKVFREVADTSKRQEIDVDLDKILNGRAPDIELMPHDLVLVPRSDGRIVSRQLLAMTTGIALSAITAMMVVR